MTPKKILFVSRKAPYGSASSKEALDAVLAASAYEQDISLLFLDDGIFQLHKNQQPDAINAKNISATLPVLPMYDIENIFVQASAMQARGLKPEQLVMAVQALDEQAIAELMRAQNVILSF